MNDRAFPARIRALAMIAIYLAAIVIVSIGAVVGVFWLDLCPVIWIFSPTHGLHTGDLLIIAIATLLITLLTVGLVHTLHSMNEQRNKTHSNPRKRE